jgi:hypothetical protein
MTTASRRIPRAAWCWGLLLVISASFYVGNTLSPSSYALTLRNFEAPDDGVFFGKPRTIRGDEWAVITPLMQATVNAGLGRYNTRSYYEEDLRTVYALPIKDWGLFFKPTMWLFLVANPAYAYSFHHFSITALFLVGWALLFRRLQLRWLYSGLLSASLFFTAFTQYWWTTLGPPLAYYPWLVVLLMSGAPLWQRTLGFYWVATCWLVSFFYPPIFIPLAFLTAALLLAYAPAHLRKPASLLAFAAPGVLACLTAVYYLRGWLQATLQTFYPGKRVMGGGGFGWERTLAQFFPLAELNHHESLVVGPAANICELAVVGSVYVLMVLCFLRYDLLSEAWRSGRLKPLRVLVPAALLMAAWQHLPLPPWVGMPLLWHYVPPSRMAFVAGLFLLLLVFLLAENVGVVLSLARVLLFGGLIVGGWYFTKQAPHGLGFVTAWRDVVVLVPVAGVFAAHRLGYLTASRVHPSLLGTSVAVAAISFGAFNPLQKAWPIFNRPETPVSQRLDALAAASPGGVLVEPGYFGATLNGWGYRSVTHVLPSPQLERFQRLLPELPAEQINSIFNRYAHIRLTEEATPRVEGNDAVAVPIRAFQQAVAAQMEQRWIQAPTDNAPVPAEVKGHVDSARLEGDTLILQGWAPWVGINEKQGLRVVLNHRVVSTDLDGVIRVDVAAAMKDARYRDSGFTAKLKLSPGEVEAAKRDLALCVVAEDAERGVATRLNTPANVLPCASAVAPAEQASPQPQ